MAGAQTGVLELPYQASAAIIKNRFVKLSGDQTVAQVAASNDLVLGVATIDISTSNFQGVNEVTAGKATAVRVLGVAWVEAGAAVTRGDIIMPDTVGRAITRTATNRPCGIALKAASAAGELIPVLLNFSLPTA